MKNSKTLKDGHIKDGENPKKWTDKVEVKGNYPIYSIGGKSMREYTAKEIKILKANPYTHNVTKNKLYFTAEFKEAFWNGYKAGVAPRKLLSDMGYDLEMFRQKQIDSIVQRIKMQAQRVEGFSQGENRSRRFKEPKIETTENDEGINQLICEVKYLRQEVEFLKKIMKAESGGKRKK